MELELNLLDWNVNELECELELEDMKRTIKNFQNHTSSLIELRNIFAPDEGH